ncbi:hypothetical protein L1887_14929 [Cichorium endivia]|nr:hypothetical protein L1887_14929 [Cichorium endivia]
MASSSNVSNSFWSCPFRSFNCCRNGEGGNKGISRMISHLKSQHLLNDDRKHVLREAISTDHGLFMEVEETLMSLGQWLCGKCMTLHAVSRACHHPNGLVRFIKGDNGLTTHIFGIVRPDAKEDVKNVLEGLVLDVGLLDRVLKTPITIVIAQPGSVDAWVRLLLLPRCTLQVFRPKNRQECRSGNRKSIQQSCILKSLATWGKEDGITTLLNNIFDNSGVGYMGQDGDNTHATTSAKTNIRQCLRKVADGHFTAAVKVLCSSGVAPYTGDTIKALEDKHPLRPPPSMPGTIFSEPPLVAEFDSVLGCIKSFPKGTSCGRDGLRAQHILDALCGEGSAIAIDLLRAITAVVNLWLGEDVRLLWQSVLLLLLSRHLLNQTMGSDQLQ